MQAGIAWDWVNEKLYWTDHCKKDIEFYDPNNAKRDILIDTGSGTFPRDIVVDPSTR